MNKTTFLYFFYFQSLFEALNKMCSDWAGFAEVRLGWAKLAKFMLASKKNFWIFKEFFSKYFFVQKIFEKFTFSFKNWKHAYSGWKSIFYSSDVNHELCFNGSAFYLVSTIWSLLHSKISSEEKGSKQTSFLRRKLLKKNEKRKKGNFVNAVKR